MYRHMHSCTCYLHIFSLFIVRCYVVNGIRPSSSAPISYPALGTPHQPPPTGGSCNAETRQSTQIASLHTRGGPHTRTWDIIIGVIMRKLVRILCNIIQISYIKFIHQPQRTNQLNSDLPCIRKEPPTVHSFSLSPSFPTPETAVIRGRPGLEPQDESPHCRDPGPVSSLLHEPDGRSHSEANYSWHRPDSDQLWQCQCFHD